MLQKTTSKTLVSLKKKYKKKKKITDYFYIGFDLNKFTQNATR